MTAQTNKRYSLTTKAAALAALERNGGSCYITAREVGIPEQTLGKWAKARREGRLLLPSMPRPLPVDASLDERLELVAQQMVAAMPEKLDAAGLQELARSLTIVLDSLNQTRTDKEKTSHAHEKLAEILERYAAGGGAAGTPEPADGG